MSKFDDFIAPVTDDMLQHWLHQRKLMLTVGPGNLCTPAAVNVLRRAPFTDSSYAHYDLIGSIARRPWLDMQDIPPAQLLNADPYAQSAYRPGKLACWDSSVIVPACSVRTALTGRMRDVKAVRKLNDYWVNTFEPASHRIGPIGPGGRRLRPEGPWIYDMIRHPLGWELLNLAHCLAHRGGDFRNPFRKFAPWMSRTGGKIQGFLAEVVLAYELGLPLDVSDRDNGLPGEPDFSQYGIEVKSSSYFSLPVLRVPWRTNEAPRPDDTVAFINAGVYIEPHPAGFNDGSDRWDRINRWSCLPTIVVIAGWETVDVVTHQALAISSTRYKEPPLCYVMHPMDLLPPDHLKILLALAKRTRGEPKFGGRWKGKQRFWRVEDYLASPDYHELFMETPPLPCKECQRINETAAGAPKRPSWQWPFHKLDPKDIRDKEWIEYFEQLKRIHAICTYPTELHERERYGYAVAPKMRKQRVHNHRVKLELLRKVERLAKLDEKLIAKHGLTLLEQQAYYELVDAVGEDDEGNEDANE